jgi:biopolymer transport protein ExbB/TolQ
VLILKHERGIKMDFTSYTFNILYTFSSALLYPVIITLILLAVYSLMLIGEFVSELAKRKRDVANFDICCSGTSQHIRSKNIEQARISLRSLNQNFLVAGFAMDAADYIGTSNMSSLEWLAQDYEVRMSKRLEQTRIIATISPMLGLMGTLIPLGPALIGLSQGDIEQLANNLMVAFATTVIGLFAGSIGYVLTQVRKRWYWQDMTDIDRILDILEEKD